MPAASAVTTQTLPGGGFDGSVAEHAVELRWSNAPLAAGCVALDAGAVKVTAAPGTGLPYASTTVTPSCLANWVPTEALWSLPWGEMNAAAGPGVIV